MDSPLRVPAHVHWRRFDADLVVIDLRSGEYFGLNDVAADTFERLAQGRTVTEVAENLLCVYTVERRQLESDIRTLVASMLERGLLVVADVT